MATLDRPDATTTYLNPVYGRPFPDPFVLKHCGEYWGYCTGLWHDGRCFGVIHSRDLVNWRELGGAMEPLCAEATCYWAPEVVYENGLFLMYYSVGDEEHMQIRVAAARHPSGPFADCGRRLTSEKFAIDPHVFVDDDGSRHLFYATDFLDHTHIGTGTVVDRMLDAWTLEGRPRPVTRARYDWQVYDPCRAEKGGVRWHTVEGPFVLKHKGKYYEMFSGGNWKNISYGVSYATADRLDAAGEWAQASDGEQVLPILRTVPGRVIGPGHNSVVRGPDNRQLVCVYHRWTEDQSARVMALDRLDWAGERMLVIGPSTTPQPVPPAPAVADFFTHDRAEGLGPNWECRAGGHWAVSGGAAVQELAHGSAEARCLVQAPCFVSELSLRALAAEASGGYGAALYGADEHLFRLLLVPGLRSAIISSLTPTGRAELEIKLPHGFDPGVYHLLRVEAEGPRVLVSLGDAALRWEGRLRDAPSGVSLVTSESAAAFAGFALSVGWEELFTRQGTGLRELGWQAAGPAADWYLEDQQMWCANTKSPDSFTTKGPALESYEMVVNAKLYKETAAGGCYGFYPALRAEARGPLVTVEGTGDGWSLVLTEAARRSTYRLPGAFDPRIHQQFCFRKGRGRLTLQWEAEVLGETDAPLEATRVGLHVHRAVAAFDMVRVTAL